MIAAILGERCHEGIPRGVAELRVLRIHDDLQIDIRMRCIEGMQSRHEPGLREAAADGKSHTISRAADRFGQGPVDLGKGGLQPSCEIAPRFGQGNAAAILLKQALADNLSQQTQLMTDGTLVTPSSSAAAATERWRETVSKVCKARRLCRQSMLSSS